MQSVLSRIWTRVTVSISNDDNHYTMGTSLDFCLHIVKCKNSLFQTIQLSIIIQCSSIWPIDRTLSGATTPGQCGPGSDSSKEILHIPQSSCITEASPPDCLVSNLGHSERESYSSAEMLSVYSAAPADWVKGWGKKRWSHTFPKCISMK